MNNLKILPALFLIFFLTGCEKYVSHHGLNPEQIDTTQLNIGKDTKGKILEKFGSPLIISKFPEAKTGYVRWSYPYQKKEKVSFLASKITNYSVLTLSFDKKGILRKIKTKKGDNLNSIKIDSDKTKSQGYESSALKDAFGTFGKYGNMESGKSPS